MRTVVSVLFFLLMSFHLSAQNAGAGKISGRVTDAATKQPVDYATVSIYKLSSATPFNGASTDVRGSFTIDNLPAGDYKITVDFLGYKRSTFERVTVSAGSTTQLNNILLSPLQNQLKGVDIVAKAPVIENRIDKMVYNAANDLTAQGGVALDVLKKVPQVTVDLDGNVELQGNSNIRFLINGKPSSVFGASLADALQAIPASQIKSIEVVTSPGAKYDAAGTGGIINIILKDSKVQGINGSVNLSAGTQRENGSLNLNARKGNFGANLFFSGNKQLTTTGRSRNERTSYNEARDSITYLSQNGRGDNSRSGYQSGLSLNWSITPKDELTGTVGFNHFGNHNTGLTDQNETLKFNGNTIYDLMSQRTSDSRFSANAIDWSLNYKKNFKKEGQDLEILYSSSLSKNTVNYLQEQKYLSGGFPKSGSRGDNPGKDRETNISIDYTHPFSKNFTVEGGAKAVLENLTNMVVTDSLLNNGVYVNNPDQSYGFNYKRNIYAGYGSIATSLFKNFLDVKAGLRYEYTSTTANFPGVDIPGYNTVAPSVTLSHKFNANQSLRLSYAYRIERPDYGEINPFYNISDPHNISTGNPNLKPEIGHNYEIGYNRSFDGGANIYAGVFYRHNTDDIQSFTTKYTLLNINGRDYPNVLLTQRANLGIQNTLGGNIFASVPVTSKLNLRTNIFLAQRTNRTPALPEVTGFNYRVNLNASYNFGKDFIAEAFGNYNSSQKWLQGNRPAFFFYNFAVRKQFHDKKASVGLTASNPFNKYITQRFNSYGPSFNQNSMRQFQLQSFGISFSYKFGKLEFLKDKDKDHEESSMPAQGEGGR